MIEINNLEAGYEGKMVLKDMNLKLREGSITAILGPNGCGKSTLLGAISGNISINEGTINIAGNDLKSYKVRALARLMAILPQNPQIPSVYGVRELVSHGRYAHIPFGRRLKQHDQKIIDWAIEKVGLTEMQCRKTGALSGGERQRALIAMALAQETSIMLLDEPTNHLDMVHQLELLQLIRHISDSQSMTVVMVIHDINHALAYADEVVMLKDGKLVDYGRSSDVITLENMAYTFGLGGAFIHHKGTRFFVPDGYL